MQDPEKLVRNALRKLKEATTKQVWTKVHESMPEVSLHRVRRILRESDFAETRVGKITIKLKDGSFYKIDTQLWVFKAAGEEPRKKPINCIL